MRVLITGATGFAGRHLTAHCTEQGDDVVASGRSGGMRADLTNAEAARALVAETRPDAVFHLAAAASVARSWEDPRTALDANVASALNLLEAVRGESPEAVAVVACSGEEYGPPERLPVDEEHPLRPQSPYAVAKVAVDLLGGLYADAHGIRVVRVRAFNHAGPGQSDTYAVSSFARQIAEAEARGDTALRVVTGNLKTRRDFTDVRDVVRAYRLLAEHAEPGVYNLCSGRSTSLADILAALAACSDLAVEQHTDPERVRKHEVSDIYGTHERISSATGWRPEIDLEQTAADALDWWRGELAP